jgi:peptide/nickel transport system substrate-binding protein
LQTISLDFPDPWIVFNFVYNSAMIGAANMPRYANEQVDALLAQADGILDEDARVELYQKAQRLVMADMPTVPLFQVRRTVAVRSDARGLDYNFSQPFFYNFQSMRREASGAQ